MDIEVTGQPSVALSGQLYSGSALGVPTDNSEPDAAKLTSMPFQKTVNVSGAVSKAVIYPASMARKQGFPTQTLGTDNYADDASGEAVHILKMTGAVSTAIASVRMTWYVKFTGTVYHWSKNWFLLI